MKNKLLTPFLILQKRFIIAFKHVVFYNWKKNFFNLDLIRTI